MNTKKGMSTKDFLKSLEIEKRRSTMLADLETDPLKKKEARRRSERARTLIEVVKGISGIETRAEG